MSEHRHVRNLFGECRKCGMEIRLVRGRWRWMPRGTPSWTDYIPAVNFKYVRTRKDGCKIYTDRSERGRRQLTRIWMRKYPWIFTKEALKCKP